MTVMYEEDRSVRFARAGFEIPAKPMILDPLRFWQLIGEGWKIVLGEGWEIIAYLPPRVEDRLNSLSEEGRLARYERRKKSKK